MKFRETKLPAPTILIVEDEPEMQSVLADVCKLVTPNIFRASNGREALDIIAQKNFHAIVSDIQMPDMDGLQLLSELKRQGNSVPFVVITGYGDGRRTKEAFRLGAQDFLEKPFFVDDLLEVIERSLHVSNQQCLLKKRASTSGLRVLHRISRWFLKSH